MTLDLKIWIWKINENLYKIMLFPLKIDLFLREIALLYTNFDYKFSSLWSKVEGHHDVTFYLRFPTSFEGRGRPVQQEFERRCRCFLDRSAWQTSLSRQSFLAQPSQPVGWFCWKTLQILWSPISSDWLESSSFGRCTFQSSRALKIRFMEN